MKVNDVSYWKEAVKQEDEAVKQEECLKFIFLITF